MPIQSYFLPLPRPALQLAVSWQPWYVKAVLKAARPSNNNQTLRNSFKLRLKVLQYFILMLVRDFNVGFHEPKIVRVPKHSQVFCHVWNVAWFGVKRVQMRGICRNLGEYPIIFT